jgi:N-acetylmuramoyl-L-alanine amidase
MCELCGPSSTYSRRDALSVAVVAVGVLAARRTGRSQSSAAPGEPIGVAADLAIWPRNTWAQSRPPLGTMQPEEVLFLLVHHTASGNEYSADQALDVMRQTYDFHTGPDKGWPDVAYNFFIDRFGRIFEGRAGSLAGPVTVDATAGSQGFAQLVCLLGDFTAVMPTPEALVSLRKVLAWLADRYGVDTTSDATVSFVSRGSNRWPAGTTVTASTISGHRDMSQTACPGDTFYPYVHDGLAADVSALRGQTQPLPTTTVPPVTTTSPPATTTLVATPTTSEVAPTTSTIPPTSTTSTVASTVPPPTPPASTVVPSDAGTDASASPDDSDHSTAITAGVAAVAAAGIAGITLAVRKAKNP